MKSFETRPWLFMLSTIIGLSLLFGCSQQETTAIGDDVPYLQIPIEVQFETFPEHPKAGEIVVLRVTVTQDGLLVENAESVSFEVWGSSEDQRIEALSPLVEKGGHDHGMEHHQNLHMMLDAQHVGKGQYEARILYQDPGEYHIMYHVTAREMHRMRENTIIADE